MSDISEPRRMNFLGLSNKSSQKWQTWPLMYLLNLLLNSYPDKCDDSVSYVNLPVTSGCIFICEAAFCVSTWSGDARKANIELNP